MLDHKIYTLSLVNDSSWFTPSINQQEDVNKVITCHTYHLRALVIVRKTLEELLEHLPVDPPKPGVRFCQPFLSSSSHTDLPPSLPLLLSPPAPSFRLPSSLVPSPLLPRLLISPPSSPLPLLWLPALSPHLLLDFPLLLPLLPAPPSILTPPSLLPYSFVPSSLLPSGLVPSSLYPPPSPPFPLCFLFPSPFHPCLLFPLPSSLSSLPPLTLFFTPSRPTYASIFRNVRSNRSGRRSILYDRWLSS